MSSCSDGQVNFFVLDTADSWNGKELQGTVAVSDSGISLPLSTEYAVEQVAKSAQFPAGLGVTSMAAACCGVLYLLDSASHSVWTWDSNQMLFGRVPAIAGLFTAPVSLAIESGTLFVADTGAARVFALALLNGQIFWTAGANVASTDGSVQVNGFTPVALAAGPYRHLYALDNVNSTVLHFDEHGLLLERLDVPPQPGGAPLTALARADDGALYVLAATGSILRRPPLGAFASFLSPNFIASGLAVDSYGFIYLGEPSTAAAPLSIWRYDQTGAPLGSVPAFSGPADLLAMDDADSLYAFGAVPPALTLLRTEATYLIPPNILPATADYFSQPFDSGSTGTIWHRLVIDADLPPNAQFLIYYRASDDFNAAASWSAPLLNASDALLMNASGRYLWMRIALFGSDSATPLIRSIRIYFPRVSYLRYLPAIYSQDPVSRDFLSRFLSIFESIFSGIETATANIVRYFDPRVVTGDFLRWLAQWLAIAVDETWTDDQLRSLLLEAPDLFRERGTPAEIAEVVRIYLGVSPFIVEQFQLACAQSADIQAVYANLYGGGPYCFCVLVPPFQQIGAAVEGNTPSYADPDNTAITAGNSIELVFGAHSYEIPLTGRNSLHGLRCAINALAVGVLAEVNRGEGVTPWSMKVRARRIGPNTLDLRTTPGNAASSILTVTNPGLNTVVSPWTEENRDALQRILDQEKPANTCGGIQVLQPRILLDMHSYLEVNSWLMKPSPMLDTGASMPFDSLVDDNTPIGQDGVRSRLALDTVLG
jgi:phage tail-like protein